MSRRNRKKLSNTQRTYLLSRTGCRCYICKKPLVSGRYSFDHIIPLAKNGLDSWVNMLPTCMECNNKKADNLPKKMPVTH